MCILLYNNNNNDHQNHAKLEKFIPEKGSQLLSGGYSMKISFIDLKG